MLKKTITWIVITQISVLVCAFIFYKRLDLLSYINVSFVIGTIFILISMAGYVMKGRFFDIVFYSFQYFFSRMTERDREPLSRLVPQNYQSPLITGIVTILLMLCALFLY
ncbi:hypothetical protein JOC34_003249 [Virgibacillus halotolerans]|uniref:DUF3899 domain-containing protein n=1 Tax=Virgibacillus halotolerans TaxID=1071053 RepID=UPI001960623A|nr:DUF3899 domain-containing protein [Virgibacillus halotolerans]MBM7600835.1 hypothetical protein [Virgibacillus halotolerans]